MAISFALDVNFGQAEDAARAAGETVAASGSITVGRTTVGLHKPLIKQETGADGEPYWLVTVLPVGVSWGSPLDSGTKRVPLTAAEYTELGHALYRLLSTLTGYRAAQVGWNAAWGVDLAELRAQYTDELEAGEMYGLVLARNALARVRGREFRPFAPGHVWIPYAGERASALTAD